MKRLHHTEFPHNGDHIIVDLIAIEEPNITQLPGISISIIVIVVVIIVIVIIVVTGRTKRSECFKEFDSKLIYPKKREGM